MLMVKMMRKNNNDDDDDDDDDDNFNDDVASLAIHLVCVFWFLTGFLLTMQICNKWLANIFPTNHHVICSEHFLKDNYMTGKTRVNFF